MLVYKFVCRGAVEDKIDQMIESKQQFAGNFLSGAAALPLTEMKDAELLRLVSLARPPAQEAGRADRIGRNDSCRNRRASWACAGDTHCRWTLRHGRRGVGVGEALIRVGVGSIPFGIAAVVLGFVLKSPGTQAGPADIGLRAERPGISVFGTIHPKIFRLRAPIGSQPMADRVRVASLGLQVGSDAVADEQDTLADAPVSAWRNASFDERFASFDERPASFDERFGSATRELTSSVRLPPDRDFQKAAAPMGWLPDAPPTPTASKRHVRPGQARRDPVPLPDDGRTAVYDIAAHAVYLPNGRRLEAHSGLGSLMDNPSHVHVKMRGATPPNVYNLALRERLFHGVRAIRLTPVDGGGMYGRAGILAHSYMLGPNGQSNGCVAFRNYPEFLNAFLKGEVTRLVVVERLENPPGPKVASGRLPDAIRNLFKPSDRVGQYAAADSH